MLRLRSRLRRGSYGQDSVGDDHDLVRLAGVCLGNGTITVLFSLEYITGTLAQKQSMEKLGGHIYRATEYHGMVP